MIRGLNPDTVITDEVGMSAFSKQEGGNHYTKMKIQPFQYSMANGLDPMQHTVIKYVTRFRDKGGVADLKKAIHTLELLIEHEQAGQEPVRGMLLMGLPVPLGTPPEVLQDINYSPYGYPTLPEHRYQAAQELVKKQASLVRGLNKGEHLANIIAPTYEVARGIARQNQWPAWTYYPVSSYLKGINDQVFIIAPKVLVTSTTLSDLRAGRNIVIQLD